jgi:hypothetical protein
LPDPSRQDSAPNGSLAWDQWQREHLSPPDFSPVFEGAVAQGLKAVLGDGGAQAILFHLDMSNFDDAKTFHERLSGLFGIGTPALEQVILQELFRKIDAQLVPSNEAGFVEQVELAKKRFDSKTRKER